MKIRKANLTANHIPINQVYLHENRKENHTLIAVPDLEWSILVSYEDEKEELFLTIDQSLQNRTTREAAQELAIKMVQWVTEM
ncbi:MULTISPECIES: YueH family protein [Bacillus]|uniref:YueH-like protein n=2 Tax=Bacillus TaxID=1386 RepID=A0A0M5JBT6_9BACI|nr:MULTISPECIES: YueH family protein [Bacillus]ALC82219.1 hypothetical protein AM592_11995 [Bacillus gobiensis]MBP1081063.1 hypothetical protein [Bacillus capparidis]MED1095753.1 YueH family protein [Bacillus capparidis]